MSLATYLTCMMVFYRKLESQKTKEYMYDILGDEDDILINFYSGILVANILVS